MDSDVLVVDDSAAIRKILQRVLRQTGMAINAIHEAGNGEEALDQLRSHKVHLILSDINMPKMDGLQLLAALKASAQWADVPVVMITTEGGEAKVAEAIVAAITATIPNRTASGQSVMRLLPGVANGRRASKSSVRSLLAGLFSAVNFSATRSRA